MVRPRGSREIAATRRPNRRDCQVKSAATALMAGNVRGSICAVAVALATAAGLDSSPVSCSRFMSSTIGRPRVRLSGTVTCPSACGPVTRSARRRPSLRSFAINRETRSEDRRAIEVDVDRTEPVHQALAADVRRTAGRCVGEREPLAQVELRPLPAHQQAGLCRSTTGCASKRAAPRSRRQTAVPRGETAASRERCPDSSVTSFTRGPGISIWTRVGRVSGAAWQTAGAPG